MDYKFKERNVIAPDHDCDINIKLPSGKVISVQLRPSNADTDYNGSLDIVLPENTVVCNWKGDDMQAAPKAEGCRVHERWAKQLVMELPRNE